jgi:hypothetical protein
MSGCVDCVQQRQINPHPHPPPQKPRQGNHIYTSGATGTNAAVIKGAVRAGAADLLTVILPQSRSKQPAESRELLEQVAHVIEMPHNDGLSLMDASRCAPPGEVVREGSFVLFCGRNGHFSTCKSLGKPSSPPPTLVLVLIPFPRPLPPPCLVYCAASATARSSARCSR